MFDQNREWLEDESEAGGWATDALDQRRESASRWNEINQKIAQVALGWRRGDGPYYVNTKTNRPTGWYTDRESGNKFEPTRKLSHAIGAAQEIARRRRALPFTLKFDVSSGWEARFTHRPYDTVVVDVEATKAVYRAILKLAEDHPDPDSIFTSGDG